MSGWLWLLLFVPPIVFLAVARNQARLSAVRSSTVGLQVDAFGVRRELADGREEAVEWTDVTEVEVLTARTGPHRFAGGVVILAGDEARGCLVPIDRVHDSGLLDGLQRLPGFDVARFAEALTAKPPRRTSCWRRGS